MTNIIGIIVLIVVVGLAAGYIIHAKKRGQKCIGCPYAKKCGGPNDCGCA